MNSAEIIGYLKECEGNFRKVEISIPTYNDEGNNSCEIYAKYWAGGDRNYFLSLKAGSLVAIRGHLDVDKNFGTIVIIEQLNCLSK